MGETIYDVNGISICAQVRGAEDAEPLLLVMGLGAQLVSWDERFIDAFVAEGFRVIWYDNRDVGRSTWFDGHDVDLGAVLGAMAGGDAPAVPYTLSDLAADGIGLLDALGIESAHIVGASMGGMIVQTMAIEHPARVRSMTSIMSTTGDPDVGRPTTEASAALLSPPPTNEAEAIASGLRAESVWGSPLYRDPAFAELRATREWNRARNPAGTLRQIGAIAASGSRTAALGALTMPVTVIHGLADTLVTPSGGERTASAIAHAVHLEIEGMGHNLPEPLWPQIVDAVVDTTRR